jgi:hypothetical protein
MVGRYKAITEHNKLRILRGAIKMNYFDYLVNQWLAIGKKITANDVSAILDAIVASETEQYNKLINKLEIDGIYTYVREYPTFEWPMSSAIGVKWYGDMYMVEHIISRQPARFRILDESEMSLLTKEQLIVYTNKLVKAAAKASFLIGTSFLTESLLTKSLCGVNM